MDDDDKRVLKFIGCLLPVLLACTTVGCFGCSRVEYSTGYRDGTVQKVSEKGLLIKTVEGEMVLGGMQFQDGDSGGTFNRETFAFSVSDPAVRKELEAVPPGKKVRIHYRQTAGLWWPSGDTRYFVTKVENVK